MSEVKKKTYAVQAQTIIKALERRNMKGYYCDTCYEAVALADSLVAANSVVSFGGSVTLSESGVMEMLKSRNDITLLDRSTATTPAERTEIFHKALSSDVYFMSSNAITLDGELVNVDGTGNRVASLIYGPQKVILIVGMNKVTSDVENALRRVHDIASPANCIRLNQQTPCALTGVCHDCLSPDCICSQTVITRRSGTKDRIQVILVGEELGY